MQVIIIITIVKTSFYGSQILYIIIYNIYIYIYILKCIITSLISVIFQKQTRTCLKLPTSLSAAGVKG